MNQKNVVLISVVCALLFVTFSLSILAGCIKEEDEFAGLEPRVFAEGEDPLAFLDDTRGLVGQNGALPETSSGNEQLNPIAYFFEDEYATIQRWGQVQFAQKGEVIREHQNTALQKIIVRSRQEKTQTAYFPIDTAIGVLQDAKDNNFVERTIYKLIIDFFDVIKSGQIDKQLNDYVFETEIPIISRQIARSSEYGPNIAEVRVGEIRVASENTRTSALRVISFVNDQESRTKLQLYFLFVNNKWYINAIEGDFNALQRPYQHPGKFIPLGTTGVTQGF